MEETIPTSGSNVPSIPTASIMRPTMFCNSAPCTTTIDPRFPIVRTSLSNRNVMLRCSAVTVGRRARSTLITAFFLRRFSSVPRRRRRCMIILERAHARDVDVIYIKIPLDLCLGQNHGRGNFATRVLK